MKGSGAPQRLGTISLGRQAAGRCRGLCAATGPTRCLRLSGSRRGLGGRSRVSGLCRSTKGGLTSFRLCRVERPITLFITREGVGVTTNSVLIAASLSLACRRRYGGKATGNATAAAGRSRFRAASGAAASSGARKVGWPSESVRPGIGRRTARAVRPTRLSGLGRLVASLGRRRGSSRGRGR